MTSLLIVAAMLVLWAGIAAIRRKAENSYQTPRRQDARERHDDDGIDRAALEEAEREVRDLDAFKGPEDGFEGDDWGPGTRGR